MLKTRSLSLPPFTCEKHADIYWDPDHVPRAAILYFHGGGLLFGTRNDLPTFHKEKLTASGLILAACDYPLAPSVKIDRILEDVCHTIRELVLILRRSCGEAFPFFLWGRSAGAYLCLLAAASEKIPAPLGVISYYGYGFLTDGWFEEPSLYYCTLPSISASILHSLPQQVHTDGPLETHYGAYVYARQTGTWLSLINSLPKKQFYLRFTLRALTAFPVPLFCAHSFHDPDVPYGEFLALTSRFRTQSFSVPGKDHDFDRCESSSHTRRLLDATVEFLGQVLLDRIP